MRRTVLIPERQTSMLKQQLGLNHRSPLFCVRWNMKGVVHYENTYHGRTNISGVYCQQIDQVNKALCQQCSALVNRKVLFTSMPREEMTLWNKRQKKVRWFQCKFLMWYPYSTDWTNVSVHLFRSLDYFIGSRTFRNKDVPNNLKRVFISQIKPNSIKCAIENMTFFGATIVENWVDCISDK